MIRRRDEDAMMLMLMTTTTMGTDGSGTSASAFSNASRARHPSSTTVPTHHRAHGREFGLEELFARVSLPATLAARSMGVSETTFKLRCAARGGRKGEKAHEGMTDRDSSRGGGGGGRRFHIFVFGLFPDIRSFSVFFFSRVRARAGSRPVACLTR
jgi:hypothetical protein|tara:strand:+ start:36009 stop:36476 length:468 start_codon:yes stop_codon:yes gene_type:complete